MKIFDEHDNEITRYDISLGRVRPEKRVAVRHAAVEAVPEKWHYEVTAQYSNGGRDVVKVVDTPGVAARDAFDEYEDVLRYVPYTEQELADREASRKPTLEEKMDALSKEINGLRDVMTKLLQKE